MGSFLSWTVSLKSDLALLFRHNNLIAFSPGFLVDTEKTKKNRANQY